MNAIILSIQAKYLAKILNGEKTKEIRKSIPKGFVGWVYLYCTKAKPYLCGWYGKYYLVHDYTYAELLKDKSIPLNGKVVARFWFDESEEITIEEVCVSWDDITDYKFMTDKLIEEELLRESCLSTDDIIDYAPTGKIYVWYIKSLQIFDKPKELWEFEKERYAIMPNGVWPCNEPLRKAPQSWCYVEVSEK